MKARLIEQKALVFFHVRYSLSLFIYGKVIQKPWDDNGIIVSVVLLSFVWSLNTIHVKIRKWKKQSFRMLLL